MIWAVAGVSDDRRKAVAGVSDDGRGASAGGEMGLVVADLKRFGEWIQRLGRSRDTPHLSDRRSV